MGKRQRKMTRKNFASEQDYINHLQNLENFRKVLQTKTTKELELIERLVEAHKQK